MKKLFALLLIVVMIFSFAGCRRGTDIEEIEKRGKIVIGVTDYKPISYKENGEWTGFDVEFARLFAKELGVEAKFVEIDWEDKYEKLEKYKIDCVWNALTIMPNYQTTVSMSDGYIYCSQILVMKADVVNNYENGYDVRKLKFVVEKSSAGAAAIEREGYKDVTFVDTQEDALAAVSKGEADCAIIDDIFAREFTGKGKKYSDLDVGMYFSQEGAGVAFRLNSDITKEFDNFLSEIRDDELTDLANKYGITLY